MTIESISDTAHMVAAYRADETERRDALFRDPFARRLAGANGEEIARTIPRSRSIAWSVIVRTRILDDLILQKIERDRIDLVLNLAAGLDSRPYRLRLPPELRWAEVDLPEISQFKREAMANERPGCRLETIALDLADAPARRGLFERLGSECQRALVLTEGLLIYLDEERVASLGHDLHAVPTFRWWLTDLASPRLLEIIQRYTGPALAAANQAMRFGPAAGPEFFRPFGWSPVEFKSMRVEGMRLGRDLPLGWLWNLLIVFASARQKEEARKMSGVVVLENVSSMP